MTNRHQHLVVILDGDYRDDDLSHLMDAIQQLRGVARVECGSPVSPDDHYARERAKWELRAQIAALLSPGAAK